MNNGEYLIKEENGKHRYVNKLKILDNGNMEADEYGIFNSKGIGLHKAKGKILIQVNESNHDQITKDIVNNLIESEKDKVKFIEEPSPLRRFNVGEEIICGNLSNCVVVETAYDGKMIVFSYDGVMDGRFGRVFEGMLSISPCYSIRKKLPTTDMVFKSDEIIEFNFRNTNFSSLLSMAFYFGINFEPEYQRGYVWNDSDKEKLIDSIFKGIEIGKMAMVKLDYSESYSYEILDGKQRLRTILDFILDKLPFKGVYFSELSYRDRNHFLDTSVPIAIISENVTEKQKHQYFLRLNTAGKVMSEEHLNKIKTMYENE